MQGTWHVRSLIRLFIGAVLLCLAWVVLTSGHASAAERPAPAQPRSDLGRTLPLVDTKGLEVVLGDLLGVHAQPVVSPAAGAAKPAKAPAVPKGKPSAQKPSGTTTSAGKAPRSKSSPSQPVATPVIAPLATLGRAVEEAELQVAPVIGVVDQTARSTVDAGLVLATAVTDVVASVPTVAEPVAQIVDGIVAVVGSVPPVGGPSPLMPLPVGGETPTLAFPARGGTAAVPTGHDARVPSGGELLGNATGARAPSALLVGSTPPPDGSARATARGELDGNEAPLGPWTLLDTAPAVPAQPSPSSSGAGPATGDQATTTPSLVLPNSSLFGRSSADWRVPRGLPAHPGTRPD